MAVWTKASEDTIISRLWCRYHQHNHCCSWQQITIHWFRVLFDCQCGSCWINVSVGGWSFISGILIPPPPSQNPVPYNIRNKNRTITNAAVSASVLYLEITSCLWLLYLSLLLLSTWRIATEMKIKIMQEVRGAIWVPIRFCCPSMTVVTNRWKVIIPNHPPPPHSRVGATIYWCLVGETTCREVGAARRGF